MVSAQKIRWCFGPRGLATSSSPVPTGSGSQISMRTHTKAQQAAVVLRRKALDVEVSTIATFDVESASGDLANDIWHVVDLIYSLTDA